MAMDRNLEIPIKIQHLQIDYLGTRMGRTARKTMCIIWRILAEKQLQYDAGIHKF